MSGNQQMPQADIAKEFSQFSDAQKHYFKKITKSNEKRGKAIGILRGQNRRFATLLGVGVLGIYFYTMHAVKQETFLDDFDDLEEPKKS